MGVDSKEQETQSKYQDTETAEVTLRFLDPSDLDDIMELLSDEKVCKWSSWDTFTSKESAMNDYIRNFALPHPYFRAICMQNKVVGTLTVRPCSGNDSCRAKLGYLVGSKYWGKGVATKAVEIVKATIFVEWPHLKRLEAVVDVENPASQRVLEKAGFKKEGVMRKYFLLKGYPRDMVMFSLISGSIKEQESDETAEVTLRFLDLSDLDDIMELFTDEKVIKWSSWDTFTSKEFARTIYISGFALTHPYFRAICMHNKVVGILTVSPCSGNDSCRAEIGYLVGSKYWGKGVATKAVEIVKKTIFIEWPHLKRLEAVADVENPASQRVLEKAGFKKEVLLRKYCLSKGNPRDMVKLFNTIE